MTVLVAGKNREDKEGFLNAYRKICSTPSSGIIILCEEISGTYSHEESLAIIERLYEEEGVLAIATGTHLDGKYYDALQSLEMAETWGQESKFHRL